MGLEEKVWYMFLKPPNTLQKIPVAVGTDFIPKSIVEEIDPNIIYNSVFGGTGQTL